MLTGHTAMVVAAAEELLEARARESLVAVGLDPAEFEQRLRQVVRLAAFAHDLGKCSDHFQQMVRRERNQPQLMRHEALSLWLCWPGQPLADWLRQAVATDEDYVTALLAAVGHHRKFAARAVAADDSGAGSEIRLLVDHADFAQTLTNAKRSLSIAADQPAFDEPIAILASRRDRPRRRLRSWELESEEIARRGEPFLAVAKALVLAADVAGSALPRAREKPRWISEQLSTRATQSELESIARKRLQGQPPRDFQRAVAASHAPITLVRAGCGSGKTVAAYLWAAANHVGRQLWVTYPTTGTTTEGFRDYIFDAEVSGRLEHGRAEVDLEIFDLGDGQDEESPRDHDRLDAIRSWGTDVITCTVDTVLGLMQNQRKGLYAWPGLSNSAVVFDEIHSYDGRLFGNLIAFLRNLPGLPVLLMTASLPEHRREQLEQVSRSVHNRALAVVDGPANLEQLKRYERDATSEPLEAATRCLREGGKVLWISNTVNRCMRIADRDFEGTRPVVYHSRFRYVDRVRQHSRLIDLFRAPGPAMASTTQVAEMSLDLSADLLITDLAPIPALIQRLGRLNRRSSPERPEPAKPVIVLPFRGPPYDRGDELTQAEQWLERLGTGPLSQHDLVAAWTEQTGTDDPVVSAWIEGGFNTEPYAVRDAGVGITVLIEDDARRIREGTERAQRVALPMNRPRSPDWRAWPRTAFLPVCPADVIAYDRERGAQWQNE